jgi:hypothetical protein
MTVGNSDSTNLATACFKEARRQLGDDASLTRVVALATRIETAVGRTRANKQEVDAQAEKVLKKIEQAVEVSQ